MQSKQVSGKLMDGRSFYEESRPLVNRLVDSRNDEVGFASCWTLSLTQSISIKLDPELHTAPNSRVNHDFWCLILYVRLSSLNGRDFKVPAVGLVRVVRAQSLITD